MRSKAGLALLIGLVAGIGTGWVITFLTTSTLVQKYKDDVRDARNLQFDFAKKNSDLQMRNVTLERRVKEMSGSVYDRQGIKGCMMENSILSSAIQDYVTDSVLGSVERGVLSKYMSSALVSSQSMSRNSAQMFLIGEQVKVMDECLDRAKVRQLADT